MNTFKNPPPIEDLGDIAWKRIEQGLISKLDALEPALPLTVQHNRLPWIAGASALVAAAAMVLLWVNSREAAPSERPALVHAQLTELSTQESQTQIELVGAKVEVAAHSSISVEQGDNRLRIDLHSGSVRLKVDKRDDMREPVAVVAGAVRVEVMGTEFAVYRDDSGTKVEVFEGVVRVTSKGQRSFVNAGETWPAEEVAVVHAVKRKHAVARSQRAPHEEKPVAKVTQSASELFTEAQSLEVSDPNQALALYARAAQGKGAWAANALFAQARLALSQGNRRAARELLTRYTEDFPNGANLADVNSLLEE